MTTPKILRKLLTTAMMAAPLLPMAVIPAHAAPTCGDADVMQTAKWLMLDGNSTMWAQYGVHNFAELQNLDINTVRAVIHQEILNAQATNPAALVMGPILPIIERQNVEKVMARKTLIRNFSHGVSLGYDEKTHTYTCQADITYDQQSWNQMVRPDFAKGYISQLGQEAIHIIASPEYAQMVDKLLNMAYQCNLPAARYTVTDDGYVQIYPEKNVDQVCLQQFRVQIDLESARLVGRNVPGNYR